MPPGQSWARRIVVSIDAIYILYLCIDVRIFVLPIALLKFGPGIIWLILCNWKDASMYALILRNNFQ